jgi:hypothetical protein
MSSLPSYEILSTTSLLTQEKLRGAVVGFIVGILVFSLNLLGVQQMKLSAQTSSIIFLYLVGNFLGYVLDILFAKERFRDVLSGVLMPLPYTDFRTRFRWLRKSFVQKYFFRFVISVIIEAITGIAILSAIIQYMDYHGIWKDWKLRNAAVGIFVAIVNFVLFVNILRFDWAYNEVENPLLDMIILMWMVLTMLIAAVSINTTTSSVVIDSRGTPKASTLH